MSCCCGCEDFRKNLKLQKHKGALHAFLATFLLSTWRSLVWETAAYMSCTSHYGMDGQSQGAAISIPNVESKKSWFQQRKGRHVRHHNIPIYHDIAWTHMMVHHSTIPYQTHEPINLAYPRHWQFGSPVMAAPSRPDDSLPRSNFECPPCLTWKIRQWTWKIPRIRGWIFVGKDQQKW